MGTDSYRSHPKGGKMPGNITRRAFLKGGIATACTAAAGGIAAKSTHASNGEPLATLVDISRCVGCEACVDACSEVNDAKYPDPQKPFPKMFPARVPVEDWSEKRDVRDRLTPYNWLYIQNASVTVDGTETELNIPRRCMHCSNPPCVKLCPFGAAQQLKNGISRIDSDICLGGSKCRKVCPWHIPQRQTGTGIYLDILPAMAGNGVMYKCDRCYDRVAQGELPACIDVCPEDVQTIGPRKEIIEQARQLAKETGGYLYGETENGGTNTIYLSPVPFEALNKAVEKGKGKPHFEKVPDAMADANNLAAALLIAPFAGIAAAVGKMVTVSRSKSREES